MTSLINGQDIKKWLNRDLTAVFEDKKDAEKYAKETRSYVYQAEFEDTTEYLIDSNIKQVVKGVVYFCVPK